MKIQDLDKVNRLVKTLAQTMDDINYLVEQNQKKVEEAKFRVETKDRIYNFTATTRRLLSYLYDMESAIWAELEKLGIDPSGPKSTKED